MPSLFTRILRGEISCHKVHENKDYFAFLDVNPINPGHTLVIPKKEVDYFFDLDDTALGGIMAFSKTVARAIRSTVPCKKIGIMVAGLEVPHAHVHLVPITSVSDLTFARARSASNEALAEMAKKIRQYISS